MLIVIMILATALAAAWLILLGRATRDDWISAAYSRAYDYFATIGNLRRKEQERLHKLARYRGIAAVSIRLSPSGNISKAVSRAQRAAARLQEGNLRGLNLLLIPGYVLQREFSAIGKGGAHRAIMEMSFELYGKKHAVNKSKQLLAKLLSYPMIGLAVTLTLGALFMGLGNANTGMAILGVGAVFVLVLVYALYDELSSRVKKRRESIRKQFPNVVSKLALLVTSGMIMDRAWKETAYSSETEIYIEMRKTSDELDNLVSPENAYGSFISRCNTRETSKLASAIMQNLAKGNAEIGKLLKNMAHEAWQERRRTAKRDAEKANSKLMIPTILLFLAILVMLMVPVAMNFTGI
ncbi:MAG: type II secretion system F family protein [Oscillospiraceae bacterium]|nr:type II secretion system F family protein [Oscillospiraceae bacterium]